MKICSSSTQAVDSSEDEEEAKRAKASSKHGSGGKKSAAGQVRGAGSSVSISSAPQHGLHPPSASAQTGQQASSLVSGIQQLGHGQLASGLFPASPQPQQQLGSQSLNPQLAFLQAGLLQPASTVGSSSQLLSGNALRDAAILQVRTGRGLIEAAYFEVLRCDGLTSNRFGFAPGYLLEFISNSSLFNTSSNNNSSSSFSSSSIFSTSSNSSFRTRRPTWATFLCWHKTNRYKIFSLGDSDRKRSDYFNLVSCNNLERIKAVTTF